MASKSNTDFLRFSAYSFKDVITRKMSEDSNFTDQIYEGSNLAILIDLCAYLYQCLVYQLNAAASESMFSDTQLYENINRLVRLIGYNPRGCQPSEIVMYIENDGQKFNRYAILPFSYIDTGLTDENGKSICFSTDYVLTNNDNSYDYIDEEQYHKVRLYNGRWRMYSKILVAGGTENETFQLEGVKSDSDAGRYVAFRHIKVFVERNGVVYKDWRADSDGIFTGLSRDSREVNVQKVYNKKEKIYSVRLNEDKTYEITFGDGIVGKKLTAGDKIYVFYLDTNGLDGNIDLADLPQQGLKLKNSAADFSISQTLYTQIINNGNIPVLGQDEDYSYYFSDTIVKARLEENTDDIRENAPSWFSTGNRLVTKADYEYWARNSDNGVVDVKCMNNWQYLTTFYRWLYQYAVKYHSDPGYYLDKDKIIRYNCKFIDAADANNIYLWVKTEHDIAAFQTSLQNSCQNIKMMTAELQVIEPIEVVFDICAAPPDQITKLYPDSAQGGDGFGKNDSGEYDSYIEITLDDNVMYVNADLQDAIANVFKKYFDVTNCRIGQLVDYSAILNEIYGFNGISNVRTIFAPSGDNLNARIINGLSFASWSTRMLDYGEDMEVGNVSRQLEDFQFPALNDPESIRAKIKIIKKQLTNISTIKF